MINTCKNELSFFMLQYKINVFLSLTYYLNHYFLPPLDALLYNICVLIWYQYLQISYSCLNFSCLDCFNEKYGKIYDICTPVKQAEKEFGTICGECKMLCCNLFSEEMFPLDEKECLTWHRDYIRLYVSRIVIIIVYI